MSGWHTETQPEMTVDIPSVFDTISQLAGGTAVLL